ncbi:unnamed protein product [Echinostoma caproni]|uniref:CCHC-type domain-containing protein n=1 Tax=Echinostoma caproni TaxID=27848 RepID=A0A183BAK4_9TREM|nr:unnamed protein product [Echinostoma caproni]
MNRHLRPEKFDTDLNAPDDSKQWTYWIRTFNALLKRVQAEDSDKLEILIKFLSLTVYEHVSDCNTFDDAISTLQSLYVRHRYLIFVRHLLATCKQECGQKVNQFVQKIKTISKDCDFRSVSAEEHRDDAMLDAFITGLLSNNIRTRLLAQVSLNFQTAYDMARSLESAQQQSRSYGSENLPCASSASTSSPAPPVSTVMVESEPVLSATSKETCYFCGYSKHPRTKCLARDATCKACGKTGHFKPVCRSTSTNRAVTSAIGPLLSSALTISAPTC